MKKPSINSALNILQIIAIIVNMFRKKDERE